MDSINYYFSDVTLLITHYNRSGSLERLLQGFKEQQCSFEDIVVSDDGSKLEHLEQLKLLQKEYSFRLITTPQNKGLGNNINKGQDAVTTAYTLYVQEDFIPTAAFAGRFKDALEIMHKENKWDIIRFYNFSWSKYPYLKPYGKGFSEMIFQPMPWHSSHLKFFYYSDHPHLRRSNFFSRFGRYMEGTKGDVTEWRMCLSFIRKKGKGLIYDDSKVLFEHSNSEDEPGTERVQWKHQKKPVLLFLKSIYLKYRVLKNTFELVFAK